MTEGWIKLHRSCLDHWLYNEYRPLTKREAWETILFTVNYEPSKCLINGQLYDCGRGQSLLSIQSWSEKFVWSVKQVRTFFFLLEKDEMIITEGLQYTTRLTVCNYDKYQDKWQTEGEPRANRGQTEGEPRATIKEIKKNKKDKNILSDTEKPKKKFVPPTLQEVTEYCIERKNKVNPAKFIAYYETRDWKVGKYKMKDWKAAVRTWELNEDSYGAASPTPQKHKTYIPVSTYGEDYNEDEDKF